MDDWKKHIEDKVAGCSLSWTDRADTWKGATSWASHNGHTYSIMLKHDPPAVVISGNRTIPITTEDQCQEPDALIALEPESARTAKTDSLPAQQIPALIAEEQANALTATAPAKPKTRSRPIASRNRAMQQATFL